MGIVLIFSFNAGLNLVLSLVVAAVLGPAEYGQFAVATMATIVLCTAGFDWLRLSATRFTAAETRASDPAVAASLEAGYGAVALLLIGLTSLALASGFDAGPPALTMAVVALGAVCNARFEFSAAQARARFLDKTYIKLVVSKNAFAFVFMTAAAVLFQSAVWLLAMFALSCAAASLIVRGQLNAPADARSRPKRVHLLTFARYGLPIVGANLVYQAIALVNRSAAAGELGFAEAGRLSLATDLTIRLLLSVGAALDAFLFQLVVRRGAEGGDSAAHRQLARNMLVIAATLIFLGLCYVATMPALEAIFVPTQYRGTFGEVSSILVPGVIAFCLVQFGLNPVFQYSRATSALLWTAVVALAVDLTLLWVVPRPAGLAGLAWVHTAGLLAGFATAAWRASKVSGCWPSRREVAAVAIAASASMSVMWPLRALEAPWLALISAGLAGISVYGVVLLGFDVAGLQDTLRRRVARLRMEIRAGAGQTRM